LWGVFLRFAAWLVRPAAPVVAAAVMALVFLANPGVLTGKGLNRLWGEVCLYRTLTGYAHAPYSRRDGCSPVFVRPMSKGR
jgi:hypothetical protein